MQTFKMLVDKWSGPAGLMVLFGAIVWGVQLNIGMLRLVEEMERNRLNIELLLERNAEIELNAARTALILDQIDNRLREDHLDLKNHLTEAEQWKREIIRNQDAIEALK